MTLSRYDTQDALYAFKTKGFADKAFFHPGIGEWQWDSAGFWNLHAGTAIDTSTAAKRAAVAAIVGDWIRGCDQAGFDAVEIDNLDTFSRSGGRLTEADNVAQMRLFADASHAAGLAIAQKNSAEIVGRKADMGTDFDLFDASANTDSPLVTEAQHANRQRLLQAMARHGFRNYPMEWWHYTFQPEPDAQTAYDVPVE